MLNSLDAYTLVVTAGLALLLAGFLLLVEFLQSRSSRSLLWSACGMLLGALCMWVLSLRLAGSHHPWLIPGYSISNLLMHACIWASIRAFYRQPISPLLFIGPALFWLLLSQAHWFATNGSIRIITYSLLVNVFVVLSLATILPRRGELADACLPLLGVLGMHGLFYGYRMLSVGFESSSWLEGVNFLLVLLEFPAFAFAAAFTISALVRADATARHRYASLYDSLTTLPNRRALKLYGTKIFERARQQNTLLSALVCDLDHFKHINDTYGHEVGDDILRISGETLQQNLREEDFCARLGGEEFLLLVRELDTDAGTKLAHRILAQIRAIRHPSTAQVTMSIGIAEISVHDQDLTQLVERADQALYEAKRRGRDCVCSVPAHPARKPERAAFIISS